ncbi:MAG: ECF-type sigma factor [Acidobacteriota bacterium]
MTDDLAQGDDLAQTDSARIGRSAGTGGSESEAGPADTTDGSADTGVTDLLEAWRCGDDRALDRLTTLVYDRLRRLAASFLRQERKEHTLQTTALIHEAYLRLIRQDRIEYQNREQFFVNAGRMMRRVLVDHWRSRGAEKRGGGLERLSEEALQDLPVAGSASPDLIALDSALEGLEAENPELARIVELKFFLDLTAGEIADITGSSTATVQRRWRLARAWLHRRLMGPD